MQSDDFAFPGHTEYLQERLADEGEKAIMIMLNDTLRVALVTGHMPISQVASSLTQELIVEKLQIFMDQIFIFTVSDYTIPFIKNNYKWNRRSAINFMN